METNAQFTDTILMVRPAHFGFNPETAENNVFQQRDSQLSVEEIEEMARAEFDNMVNTLRSEGVNIIVVEDTTEPLKTDAIFPNNWFSTHKDGSLYLFPMFSPNRRQERRKDIIDLLDKNYVINPNEDLLIHEKDEKFLEGTGSMILDRENKVVYACYSERTNPDLLDSFGEKIGYDVVGFAATDENGIPYYHTNVIMTLGRKLAIICTESIEDISQKEYVINSLKKTHKLIVEITRDQVLQFAGNMLEVRGSDELPLLVMSEAAFKALSKDQLHIIKKHNKIVYLGLSTIEKFGGGSARCMMAEIFSPNRD